MQFLDMQEFELVVLILNTSCIMTYFVVACVYCVQVPQLLKCKCLIELAVQCPFTLVNRFVLEETMDTSMSTRSIT